LYVNNVFADKVGVSAKKKKAPAPPATSSVQSEDDDDAEGVFGEDRLFWGGSPCRSSSKGLQRTQYMWEKARQVGGYQEAA
jgi:hypothetical protein